MLTVWEPRKGLPLDAKEAAIERIMSRLESPQEGLDTVFTGCLGTGQRELPDGIT